MVLLSSFVYFVTLWKDTVFFAHFQASVAGKSTLCGNMILLLNEVRSQRIVLCLFSLWLWLKAEMDLLLKTRSERFWTIWIESNLTMLVHSEEYSVLKIEELYACGNISG